MLSYPTIRHKWYSYLCFIGEKKSWVNDTEALPHIFSLKKVFSGNAANPRELPRSCVISTNFHRNFTEIYFCMSATLENRYIFAKVLPIRKRPVTISDDEIHVTFYYQLKKQRFKRKTQITFWFISLNLFLCRHLETSSFRWFN